MNYQKSIYRGLRTKWWRLRYDTSLVLKFENKGLVKAYLNYDTASVGVGELVEYYNVDKFTATITFIKTECSILLLVKGSC